MAAPVSEQYAERTRAVPETALRDHFNGNLRVLDTGCFASIRKLDDFWMLVMLPQAGIGSRYLVPVGIAETGIPAAEREAENQEPPIREEGGPAGKAG